MLKQKVSSIALVLLVCIFFGSCSAKPYPFRNPTDSIVSVEIVDVKDVNKHDYAVIKRLSDEEARSFVADFQNLRFKKYLGDPAASVFGIAVKISYSDGSFEYICAYTSQYFLSDSDRFDRFGRRSCSEKEFCALIDEYLPAS